MNIKRANANVTKRGQAEYFTGAVSIEDVSAVSSAPDVRVSLVSFAPGARTAWHTHPHGQLLHIWSGAGLVQMEGGEILEVLPGDSIWFEPGERHWHGATPNRAMVHLAIQRADAAGQSVTWQEHVSDKNYPPAGK